MHARWGHRALGRRWWLAVLVVPLALAGAVTAVGGDDLESDLQRRIESALADRGVEQAVVAVDGRDVTISGLAGGTDAGVVRHAVADVDGVRTVEVEAPEVLGAGTCPDVQRRIDRIVGDDRVSFAPDSARLAGDERRQVVRVGRLLQGCRASVTVRGVVTDPQSDAVSGLSQRRAQRVSEVVVASGGVVDVVLGGVLATPDSGSTGDHVAIVVS